MLCSDFVVEHANACIRQHVLTPGLWQDTDGNGTISLDELREGLAEVTGTLREPLEPQAGALLIKQKKKTTSTLGRVRGYCILL